MAELSDAERGPITAAHLQCMDDGEIVVAGHLFTLTVKLTTCTKQDIENYFAAEGIVLYSSGEEWVSISADGFLSVQSRILSCVVPVNGESVASCLRKLVEYA
jgi:hypothetical protein